MSTTKITVTVYDDTSESTYQTRALTADEAAAVVDYIEEIKAVKAVLDQIDAVAAEFQEDFVGALEKYFGDGEVVEFALIDEF